ncbi:PAS domain-containing sensor histidine kinase [uncultured Bacteroides sp.]|uniref:sensor histidine kinase n=1 Tax=uncultured Bacteroides sp. TaxID=162156 RepID=UPI0025D5912B|nr:ATP-binding protein [uncultured Bacteroides sp.]
MIFSRHLYWMILLHIVLILVTSGTGSWLIISQRGFVIGTLLVVCSLFQIGALVDKLNSFNQKLRIFFDAIEDKDNMLYFPEHHVNKDQERLNRSLNRINLLLAKTQAEYAKQEHFYRSLLEEVPNGVLAWDSTGKIILANSAAHSLLACKQLTHHGQLQSLLYEKGRKEHLSLSKRDMKLQEETITLLSIKDIGDELSDKESESWNKLSHVLTHEIMNTIAPIISLSQTLSAYPDINEKAIRGLRIIQAQSERLLQFTESFRHLSYLPQPDKKRFSLTATLENLRELLSGDFQANSIAFSLTCLPETIYMEGDENQLSQVLLNLLKNSMQALEGKENGSIRIDVRQSERITIDIEDNGTGIPPELQEKVFIPFYTTKTEGSGIGLTLCKQIVRLHNGHLTIHESSPGKTVFHIDIPL